MRQKSRIETLDAELREHAENLLDKGATEQEVADYINDVVGKDEGKDAEEIRKNPIRQQNVNRWKNSELAARKAARQITANFEKIADSANRDKHLDNIVAWLTAQVANEILEFDRTQPEGEQRITLLRSLIQDAATLRKLAYEGQWLDAEQRRVVVGESRHFLQIKKEARDRQKEEEYRLAEQECMKHDKVYKGARAIFEKLADEELNSPDPVEELKRKLARIEENDPESDVPDRADKFRETLTEDQAQKLGGILTTEQMEQLGLGEPAEEDQEQDNPGGGEGASCCPAP